MKKTKAERRRSSASQSKLSKGAWWAIAKGKKAPGPKQRRALAVYNLNNGYCWICGQRIPHPINEFNEMNYYNRLTVDHIVPKSIGGIGDLDNLLPAHNLCNEERGDAPTSTIMGYEDVFRKNL
ncbi:MAG: HNH endonuclease, partial [Thermodesulfobacteriota bacterium]